jgi:hypothetical protein
MKFFLKGLLLLKMELAKDFWDDTWIGDKPLKDTYPALYNIARDRQTTISKVVSSRPLNISFRRSLVDNNPRQWLHLVARVSNVVLVDRDDYFKWLLTKNGLFTVRSMYLHAIDTHLPFQHKKI